MSFVESSQQLWKEVSSIVTDEGLRLYDLERLGNGGLRVAITKDASGETQERGQGGITTDDCARVCRRLMTYFSVEGPAVGMATEPQLEVCSPGVNRALRLPEHFSSAIGERIKVVWQERSGEQSRSQTVVGVLEVFEDNCLSLIEECSGDKRDVLLNDVRKAKVDFPF